MNNIEKTVEYLFNLFENSEYLHDKIHEKNYRLDHTFRVANIGKEIAEKENLDVEAVVIGCLLHDVSYIYEMSTDEQRKNHGRKSAHIVRDFVMNLDMADNLKQELLFGIAIHVDDQADFVGEHTILAETIGESDNIDRFDRYRLYENLYYSKMDEMSSKEKHEYVKNRINRLRKLKEYPFKTTTSSKLWNEKLDVQIDFYQGLYHQLLNDDYTLLFEKQKSNKWGT